MRTRSRFPRRLFSAALACWTGAAVASAAAAEPGVCPEGGVLTLGPPAAELFDPHMPQAREAVWCEVYDERGRARRVGRYSDHYPSGAPRSRARFVADKLEGELLILHENGRVWLHTGYSGGQLDGPYTLFSPAGAPWLSAQYRDGVLYGRQTSYFEEGGKASETWYRAGVEHGLSRAWFPGGQLRQAIEVRDGRFVGEHVSWHPNGRVARAGRYAPCPPDAGSAACHYLGAAPHGRWVSHHPSGALRAREDWHFGRQTGTRYEWHADGTLASMSIMAGASEAGNDGDRLVHNEGSRLESPTGTPRATPN